MTDERLSSALEEIRAEALGSIAYAGGHDCPDSGNSCSAHHALRLLAAVEAVLKLADDWDDGGLPMRALNQYRGRGQQQAGAVVLRAVRDCADQLREAITRSLTGKEEA